MTACDVIFVQTHKKCQALLSAYEICPVSTSETGFQCNLRNGSFLVNCILHLLSLISEGKRVYKDDFLFVEPILMIRGQLSVLSQGMTKESSCSYFDQEWRIFHVM